jgi:hypothetical protein
MKSTGVKHLNSLKIFKRDITQSITPMTSISPNNNILMMKLVKIIILLTLAIIISGCGVYTKSEQAAHPELVRISQENQLGQSFVARYDGLQGISLFLKPGQDSSGEITLSLFEKSDYPQALRSSTIQSSEIESAGFYNFPFFPINNSAADSYYFELTFDGEGNIRAGSAPGNSYLSGAQYLDGTAQNSQTTFRLNYSSTPLALGLFLEGLSWIGYLILAILMFALPGWAALSWLFPPWKNINWISKFSLSIGIGIAFYPVLFLWLNTLGIHSNFLNVLTLPVLGLIFILINFSRENKGRYSNIRNPKVTTRTEIVPRSQSFKSISWQAILPDISFVLVLLFVVFTRFWPIRILDAPMWGDSYQHTMIAQLLTDNGGLFTSWEPYASLNSFTYHFGFHSLVSNFHWLSGLSVIQSTLWVGQILNIFAIIALYPLAVRIGKNKWAGVFAVLIAGLISSMPMFYVNWGRYTQLAGQIILPAVILIVWKNLDSEENSFRWHSLVWVGLAGLALTHYRVMIFIPLFYISYFLFHLKERQSGKIITRTLIHAGGMLLLIIPWLIRVFEGTLPRIFGSQISTSASNVSQAQQNINSIGNITSYLPAFMWLLILVAVGWGIFTRNRKNMIFSFWWLLIFLAANPNLLRLPGTGILTNFAVFIAAYIPAGILIGASLASFLQRIGILISEESPIQDEPGLGPGHRRRFTWSVLLLVAIVIISAWSVRPRLRVVRPAEHALLTRPDLKAANWIEENLPKDAKFLVNSFFAYGGTLVVGSDGGLWLPLLTLRESTQPPLLYGSENATHPQYVQLTNSLVALIEEKGIDHPEVLRELNNRNITHIFIGQQQGQVNTKSPLLDPQKLVESRFYRPIYHQDRAWIFSVIQETS